MRNVLMERALRQAFLHNLIFFFKLSFFSEVIHHLANASFGLLGRGPQALQGQRVHHAM